MALTEAEIQALLAANAAVSAKHKADAPARAARLAAASASMKARNQVESIRRQYPSHAHPMDVWDATRYVNRSVKTLQRWARMGIVKTMRVQGELRYDMYWLKAARVYMEGRQRASRIDGSATIAGPGRPKDSTAREEIVNLLVVDASMSNRAIARRVGVSHTLVSSVRREWQ